MKFEDIPRYVTHGNYMVNYDWPSLEEMLNHYGARHVVELEPDFQRAHVWTDSQRTAYIEHVMKGGVSGRDIYFNFPYFDDCDPKPSEYQDCVLVDGLQRLTAARMYMANKVKAFGCYLSEMEGPKLWLQRHCFFNIHINNLKSKELVLTWYLEMNSGGTPHTDEELNRVRELLKSVK